MAGTGKPGPHGKGPREKFLTRMPAEIRTALHEAALERGMTANDLVVMLIAQHTGRTHLIDQQEVLALQKSA